MNSLLHGLHDRISQARNVLRLLSIVRNARMSLGGKHCVAVVFT